MLPLALADFDSESTIKKVSGSAEVKKHLEDLGFVPGAIVKVVTRNGENVIVNIKETRVAINSDMARKIMV
ncbi:MAG: ferrous iron transport protein A [Sphaerochaetaceae bacterium]|nr:ferrous iron transport protein A [Sphaerochaetaceae bacterium]